MSIGPDDHFLGVCRISREGFADAIAARPHHPGLEAERELGDYWDESRAWGVDPCFLLAMYRHESQFGSAGVAIQTRSWGNTRSPCFGAVQIDEVAGRSGMFPVLATHLDGCASTAGRLASPIWPAAAPYGARASIREVFDHPSGANWAPRFDLNDPDAYLASMLRLMNEYADQDDEPIEATRPPAPPVLSRFMTHSFWPGRDGHLPLAIVLHITQGATAASAYSWWATISTGEDPASANYIIDRDGAIWCCVRERDTAWCNGRLNQPDMRQPLIRRWVAGGINPNKESISVECAGYSDMQPNADPALNGYTEAQYASLGLLLPALSARHAIDLDAEHLLGHFDIDSVNRRDCPGISQAEWDRLYRLEEDVIPDEGYSTANAAFDAYLAQEGETAVWAGVISGKGHWTATGRDPLEICRTDANAVIGYDGTRAVDVGGSVLDDWEGMALAAGQLRIF